MSSSQNKARIATVIVLALALGLVVWKRSGWKPSMRSTAETTPQDAIYAMLDAARAGNVNKYLASYTGPMVDPLKQTISESPDFSKYLRDSNAAIKGIAIQEPEVVSANEMKARVEYVFQDRNEVQFMYLQKTPAGWKIARVDSAERVKTLVPYGTPVR